MQGIHAMKIFLAAQCRARQRFASPDMATRRKACCIATAHRSTRQDFIPQDSTARGNASLCIASQRKEYAIRNFRGSIGRDETLSGETLSGEDATWEAAQHKEIRHQRFNEVAHDSTARSKTPRDSAGRGSAAPRFATLRIAAQRNARNTPSTIPGAGRRQASQDATGLRHAAHDSTQRRATSLLLAQQDSTSLDIARQHNARNTSSKKILEALHHTTRLDGTQHAFAGRSYAQQNSSGHHSATHHNARNTHLKALAAGLRRASLDASRRLAAGHVGATLRRTGRAIAISGAASQRNARNTQ